MSRKGTVFLQNLLNYPRVGYRINFMHNRTYFLCCVFSKGIRFKIQNNKT
jgi:hypothetical protein